MHPESLARKLRLILATIFVTAVGARLAPLWVPDDYSRWAYSMPVFINTTPFGADVEGTVRNFPLCIRLSRPDFDFSQAARQGRDVRFSGLGGKHLPYEIEWWDSIGGTAALWVKVDTIYGNNSSQSIIMHWGNPDASDSSNSSAVFVTSSTSAGFTGVWHLGTDGAVIQRDATANGNNGTPSWTGTRRTDGVIGKGQWPRDGEYLRVLNSTSLNITSNLTISAWVKGPGTHQGNILSKYTWSNANAGESYKLTFSPEGVEIDIVISNPTILERWLGTDFPQDEQWQYVTGVHDGATNRLLIYVNGRKMADTAAAGGIRSSATDVLIGAQTDFYGTICNFLNRPVDEVRVARVAHSPDWIRLCYENQRSDQRLVCLREPCGFLIITEQPRDTTVYHGTAARFAIRAEGAGLSYQWYRDGAAVPGANDSERVIPSVTVDTDSGALFSCQVSDGVRTVMSRSALLTVVPCTDPVITTQPASITRPVGGSATFSVVAQGLGLTYQWKRNDADIPGAVGAVYVLPFVAAVNNGDEYRVLIRNGCGRKVLSTTAVLTVSGSLLCEVSQDPASDTVEAGDPFVARVGISCENGTLQWLRNGTPIPGAQSFILITDPVTLDDNGARFRCVVSNGTVADTSGEGVLTVVSPKNGNRLVAISGELRMGGGEIVGRTGPQIIDLTVRLFTVPAGGAPVYTEIFRGMKGVIVREGHFTVQLGRGKTSQNLQAIVASHRTLFAELWVGGPFDEEVIGPRLALSTAPYAMSGGVAVRYGSGQPSDTTVSGVPVGTMYVDRADGNRTWKKLAAGWVRID